MTRRTPRRPSTHDPSRAGGPGGGPARAAPDAVFRAFVRTLERLDPTLPASGRHAGRASADGSEPGGAR